MNLLKLAAVCGLALFACKLLIDRTTQSSTDRLQDWMPTESTAAKPAAERALVQAPSVESLFKCDERRHCSQMRSCAEARFFLANCPNTLMDGDSDGIPCEDQHCTD